MNSAYVIREPHDCERFLRQLRADALARLALLPMPTLPDRAPQELLRELQVCQVEIDMLSEELRRANATLADSRKRSAELYDFAPLGYLTLGPDASIVDVSPNGAALLGAERSKLLGVPFDGFVAPREAERWRRHFFRSLQDCGKHAIELPICRGDGTQFQARLHCLRLEEGNDVAGLRFALFDISDVTELRRLVAETRIPAVVFESQQGMVITDAHSVILRANSGFTSISGYTEPEVVGQAMSLLKSGRHNKAFYEAMWKQIGKTGSWHGEVWNRRKNGHIFPAFVTITAVARAGGEVTHYVGTMVDITQRKAAEDAVQRLAFYDPLTKLPNRRLLLDRLKRALASSARTQRMGALLFVDLDEFKELNDTHGHDIGDLLLLQVAERLAVCIREGDTVARLGGDEFVVVLESLADDAQESAAQVERVGEKMLAVLAQPYRIGAREIASSASIGVTLFADHQNSVSELMKRADLAMYEAKAAGRNALRFFDHDMQVAVAARAALESDMRDALLKREFVLHFQPQVGSDGRLLGFEALLRWRNPKRGLMAPAEFLPLAEKSGLIQALGLWVLEGACHQLAHWASAPNTARLSISVNVSARQIHEPDFVEQVAAVLERSAADPHKLVLELPESVLLYDADSTIGKMRALKAYGVSLALDNFGTGYSCLAFLKRVPVDQLKIDRSFVRNLMNSTDDSAIASMVVALAKSLNVAVVAEGVETTDQRDFLAHRGCSEFQGYLYGAPLPKRALRKLLVDGAVPYPLS